jgi:hypothetical protein
MRRFAVLSLCMAAAPVLAAEMRSDYTDIDLARDCALIAAGADGEDYGSYACAGWKGYPVLIHAGDLRESVVYGFPPGGAEHAWESFSAFNATSAKIEWRISVEGRLEVPVATIHRWFVSNDPEDAERRTEVLVVEKVGQPGEGDGCAIGLVVATGNPKANETARRIADEQAVTFSCGADERVLVVGDVPLPDFHRQD